MDRSGWARGAGPMWKVDGAAVRGHREGPRAGERKRGGRNAGEGLRAPGTRSCLAETGPSVAW